jgi:hypothetical protein
MIACDGMLRNCSIALKECTHRTNREVFKPPSFFGGDREDPFLWQVVLKGKSTAHSIPELASGRVIVAKEIASCQRPVYMYVGGKESGLVREDSLLVPP